MDQNAILEMFQIPIERVVEFTEQQLAWVQTICADGSKDNIMPHLAVLGRQYSATAKKLEDESVTLYALATGFNEDSEKYSTMSGIGKLCHESRFIPLIACLTAEAWMAQQPNPRPPEWEPRLDAKRIEVVTAATSSFARLCVFGKAVIHRTRDGLITLGQSEIKREGVETRLVDEFFRGFLMANQASLAEHN